MEIKKTQKNAKINYCDEPYDLCYEMTGLENMQPHAKNEVSKARNEKNAKNARPQKNICQCKKSFVTNSGLWKHKQKCEINKNNIYPTKVENDKIEENTMDKDFFVMMLKENHELKHMVLEVCKNLQQSNHFNNNIINSNNHSHNQTFNLQFFLNETCKNAMNIMDFVDSIQLQLSDLEKVGRLGYIDGISDIIIKNLKALDVTERPVHCSDSKREVVYVKDDNKWEKENEDNTKIRKAIKRVANKNIQLIPEWKEKYPDCVYSDSKKSDQYNHIVIEAMGGDYKSDIKDSENKIIKKIAKEVVIDK